MFFFGFLPVTRPSNLGEAGCLLVDKQFNRRIDIEITSTQLCSREADIAAFALVRLFMSSKGDFTRTHFAYL